jgi:hypothetical protein
MQAAFELSRRPDVLVAPIENGPLGSVVEETGWRGWFAIDPCRVEIQLAAVFVNLGDAAGRPRLLGSHGRLVRVGNRWARD